jgi:hypothetical protein
MNKSLGSISSLTRILRLDWLWCRNLPEGEASLPHDGSPDRPRHRALSTTSGFGANAKICFLAVLCLCLLTHLSAAATEATSLLAYPPLLAKPTASSITVNLATGEKPILCYVMHGRQNSDEKGAWTKTVEQKVSGQSTAEFNLTGLNPDTRYNYRVHARPADAKEYAITASGSFRTQKLQPGPFSFALISDSHITPFHKDRLEVLSRVSSSVIARRPDFLLMLGDNIQTFTSHGGPMTDPKYGPALYGLLRQGLGSLTASIPVFLVNGNWEGENGWHPFHQREWAKAARKAYFPNPGPGTYPQGGSQDQDYYGFTWGDALFLVLNVTGYTSTTHALSSPIGKEDDWTLGEKQRTWLREQLAASSARWKLLFIHHTVGGKAGDDVNSRYGRGGGRAARVGEQAFIHQLMRRYGAQALFYGHDHVFTDMVVDGIHYTCVGSAGAPWKFTTEETGYEKYWTPSGFTWVDVTQDSLKVSFVAPKADAPQDETFHSFVISR